MFSNSQSATQKPAAITPPRPIATVKIITDVSQIRGAEDVAGKVVHLLWRIHGGVDGGNHLVKSIVPVGGDSFLSVQKLGHHCINKVYYHFLEPEERLIPLRGVSLKPSDWYPDPRPTNQGSIYSERELHQYYEQCAQQRAQEPVKLTRAEWLVLSGTLIAAGAMGGALIDYLTSPSSSRVPASNRSLDALKLPERHGRE